MNQSIIKLSILTLLIITGLFTSCKKDHPHDDIAPESVTITIDGPTSALECEHGDTVYINARISALVDLHGYEVHLKRVSDSTDVFTVDHHAHGSSFDIKKYWVNDCMTHTAMELEICAITDHDGSKVSKKVQFHCHGH